VTIEYRRNERSLQQSNLAKQPSEHPQLSRPAMDQESHVRYRTDQLKGKILDVALLTGAVG